MPNHRILEKSFLSTIASFISGLTVSVTLRLYKMSRNYRYVTRVLAKEKKELKVSFSFEIYRWKYRRVWFDVKLFSRLKKISDKDIELVQVICGHHFHQYCEHEGMLNILIEPFLYKKNLCDNHHYSPE